MTDYTKPQSHSNCLRMASDYWNEKKMICQWSNQWAQFKPVGSIIRHRHLLNFLSLTLYLDGETMNVSCWRRRKRTLPWLPRQRLLQNWTLNLTQKVGFTQKRLEILLLFSPNLNCLLGVSLLMNLIFPLFFHFWLVFFWHKW